MFKIACLKHFLFRTGKFEKENWTEGYKKLHLWIKLFLNTVVLRTGLAVSITDYIDLSYDKLDSFLWKLWQGYL